MNKISKATKMFVEFEKLLGLGPVNVSRVLGIEYSTYAGYKNGSRTVPRYVHFHMDCIKRLPDAERNRLTEDRLRKTF